ncbi:MAG: cyclic nucleotide-binding domain-containing protein [Myxococcaceae bacterium]|jgi:CRP-like cAMP-binding protein|nr:cyclic nucleotide-binding domain-containing protein [Myxococcaceae bacterium]
MGDAVRELKDKATELTLKGKLPAAIEAWQKVVAAAPDDVPARQKVAELQSKAGRFADSVATYEEVAKRYAEKGLFFKASAVCRLIQGSDPAHQRTLDLIASLYARSKPATPPKPVATPAPEPEVIIDLDEPIAPPTASGLPSIPLFSMLSEAELKEVLRTSMEVRAFVKGDVVVSEGAPGDSMFALSEGAAGVFRAHGTPNARRVAAIGAGDSFGEVALVSGASRVATVVVESETAVALEFPREAIYDVARRFPPVRQRIEAFTRERLLLNLMRANPVLRALPESSRAALQAAFRVKRANDGEALVTEGSAATGVSMLLRGVCLVTHQSGERYPDLKEGDLFGEVSVLTGGPATATVTAMGEVLTLQVSAEAFTAIVLSDPAAALAVKTLAKQRVDRTAQYDKDFGIAFVLEDSRV